ncbi:MAG: hypothetical protein ACRCV6_03475 [Formosimonas sp.]
MTENSVQLTQELKLKLREFLRDRVWFNEKKVFDSGWVMSISDDKQIIDGDEDALSLAIRSMGCDTFFIAPIRTIMTDEKNDALNHAYSFSATADDIEAFQFHGKGGYICYGDCLFFDKNCSFLVIRPDDHGHLLYAGSKRFIDIACSANDWWWAYPSQEACENVSILRIKNEGFTAIVQPH